MVSWKIQVSEIVFLEWMIFQTWVLIEGDLFRPGFPVFRQAGSCDLICRGEVKRIRDASVVQVGSGHLLDEVG